MPRQALEAIDIIELMKLLPHRYPFLLVDRIIDIDADNSAIGIKNVTVNEPHFQGHFPGPAGHAGRADHRGDGADGRRHLHHEHVAQTSRRWSIS